MRTAVSIFLRDLKRILKNPVALVVAAGVCIIPSVYAWLNILANWDPYENTSTVPIAVVIEDKGADIEGMGNVNAGQMVKERLEENTQLGWTFVDDEDEALEGVRSGSYYAAFVIPSDFTSSLADVLDGNTDQAHIAYYANEKMNAISPKVTDTGASTLETQIANQFVDTVGKTVTEKLQGATKNAASEVDTARDDVVEDLRQVHDDVQGLADDLADAKETLTSARGTVSSARSTLRQASRSATSLHSSLKASLNQLQGTRADAQTLATQLQDSLFAGSSALAGLSSNAAYNIGQIAGDAGWAQGQLDASIKRIRNVNDGTVADVRTSLERLQMRIMLIGLPSDQEARLVDAVDQALQALQDAQDATDAKLDKLQAASDTLKGSIDAVTGLSGKVNQSIQTGSQGLIDLQKDLQTSTMPGLTDALDDFSQVGGSLEGAAGSLPAMLDQADASLEQLDAVIVQSGDALDATSDSIGSAAERIQTLADDVSAVQSASTFEAVKTVLSLDATKVGDFMGSPVDLNTQPVYPVANYGSGVTPFYTNLALWVGGFVLVAIYKLEVDDEGIGRFKPWQGFFGRWFLLNLIGQLQAIVCCVGDLALGIQCNSPIAFVFAGMVQSFVYVFFIYAISVAFKHIGKALGVLLVILQIPGASGTYPIEMMPGFFQALHPWLPFTYGINAMREAIAGFYGDYYAHNLLMLLVFLIPALLIGVTFRRYLLNVNALFDRRLGETDLMITERVGMEGAHFRLSTIVKVIMGSSTYKKVFLERAAKFELMYPVLVKRGFAALIVVPLVLLTLLFVTPAKYALLICWIVSLIVICTGLIVIEYLHARVASKTSLADMAPAQLYALLDDELRQEFMAFAPLDKMRLDRMGAGAAGADAGAGTGTGTAAGAAQAGAGTAGNAAAQAGADGTGETSTAVMDAGAREGQGAATATAPVVPANPQATPSGTAASDRADSAANGSDERPHDPQEGGEA